MKDSLLLTMKTAALSLPEVNTYRVCGIQKELWYSNNKKCLAWHNVISGSHQVAWDNFVQDEYPDDNTHTTEEHIVVITTWLNFFFVVHKCT